jgi:hypothetical protein
MATIRYAIAAILRAKDELLREGNAVTISGLAQKMKTDTDKLSYYVSRVVGLREELRPYVKRTKGEPYLAAIDAFRRTNIILTQRRLAFVVQQNGKAVKAWVSRHKGDPVVSLIVTEATHKRHLLIQRLRWIRKSMSPGPLNLCRLAIDAHCDRSMIRNALKRHPELKQELLTLSRKT